MTKKGELLAKLELPDESRFQMSGPEIHPDWCTTSSAKEAITAFRKHFQCETLLRTLTVSESSKQYEVISEQGRLLKPKACVVAYINGPPPINDADAAAALEDAIERHDPQGVRDAIQSGASLEHLPESPFSPLRQALYLVELPGGLECAQALVDAGASMSGLTATCLSGFEASSWCVTAAEFLISNGADVREADRYGMTPIWGAVRQRNISAIHLLMDKGADPNVPIANMQMTVTEWVRSKFEESKKQREQTELAAILSILTAEDVRPPEKSPLPEEFARENQRFQQALYARQVLSKLPEQISVEPGGQIRSKAAGRFEKLGLALEELGFLRQGQYVDDLGVPKTLVAYVHPEEKLDAIVQDYWWIDTVGCRILAYGADRHLFSCSNMNLKTADEPELPSLTALEFPGTDPQKLMTEVQQAVSRRGVERLINPPDDFQARFVEGHNRVLTETKACLLDRLETGALKVNGERPLFERRQIYLDFSSWDDPSRCSSTAAQDLIEELAAPENDFDRVERGVHSAFRLLAMQRLQFAGAPKDDGFLKRGCELAVLLFERLKTTWKRHLSFDQIDELWMSLILCQVAVSRGLDFRPSFEQICQAVQPRMATLEARYGNDIPLALGEWTVYFISGFRKRAFPKLHEWRERVSAGRNMRAKYLLKALDALELEESLSIF
ncbi:MAG: hypothetical protein R3C49_16370 [Planctomycetaceae bacterium]